MLTESTVPICHPQTGLRKSALTGSQVSLLFLVLGLGLALLLATVQVALLNTVLIFLFVALVGLQQCHVTQRKLGDPKLHLLGTFWLVKLGLTLFLLYAGWIPELDPDVASMWGTDQQRFYRDAFNLIGNDWVPTASNYQGIIYYYGLIFYLFGHNPVIPALINAFVTLLGTLFLIRMCFEFKGNRGPRDWTLAYLLLIPEMLWYDVLTGREPLMAVLILVATLSAGRYIVRSSRMSLTSTLLIIGICLGAILAVRTSMAIPVAGSIIIMAFLGRGKKIGPLQKLLMITMAVALMAVGPQFSGFLGGSKMDYWSAISNMGAGAGQENTGLQWSENSVGLLFVPNNMLEAVLFLLPRMMLYLAGAATNLSVDISGLIGGSWVAWQHLMVMPTSIINLIIFPYVLAASVLAWKQRRVKPKPLMLHIAFWITFIAIGGGNVFIMERYRVMVTLLLYACAWIGYTTCTRAQVRQVAVVWFSLLGAGVMFYFSYKIL